MISPELLAEIRRLYYAEHWKISTIASELKVHADTVRGAVERSNVNSTAAQPRPNPLDVFLPYWSDATIALLDPRGIDGFVQRLRRLGQPFAISGSLPAAHKVSVAPPRLAIAYVQDPMAAAETLELRTTDRGANPMLAARFDPVVFDRSWSHGGVTYAALSKVAADLLANPARGRAEAEELIAWMRKKELTWRT